MEEGINPETTQEPIIIETPQNSSKKKIIIAITILSLILLYIIISFSLKFYIFNQGKELFETTNIYMIANSNNNINHQNNNYSSLEDLKKELRENELYLSGNYSALKRGEDIEMWTMDYEHGGTVYQKVNATIAIMEIFRISQSIQVNNQMINSLEKDYKNINEFTSELRDSFAYLVKIGIILSQISGSGIFFETDPITFTHINNPDWENNTPEKLEKFETEVNKIQLPSEQEILNLEFKEEYCKEEETSLLQKIFLANPNKNKVCQGMETLQKENAIKILNSIPQEQNIPLKLEKILYIKMFMKCPGEPTKSTEDACVKETEDILNNLVANLKE